MVMMTSSLLNNVTLKNLNFLVANLESSFELKKYWWYLLRSRDFDKKTIVPFQPQAMVTKCG